MNIIDEKKCAEFKHILSGCRTVLDAYYFAELYINKNPEMKSIVHSMVNGKRYDTVLDFKTLKSTLELINECQYREDADDISDTNAKKTCDIVQIRSFTRISRNKPNRPINLDKKVQSITKIDKPIELVMKHCPHCNHKCTTNFDASYVICGNIDPKGGFDWKGCNKDWCFTCGKMLCKNWYNHDLFVEMNRFHDSECCKIHAKENDKTFPDDYCMCSNIHVKR